MAEIAPHAGERTLIYLVRHGQTLLNETGVLRGLLDPPLDEAGQHQARLLGAALGPHRPSAVVASPLLRARQTAQPVADRAGLVVTTDECLLDRDYGQWTGIDRESVVARWGSVDNAPGVEPLPTVRNRAVRGLTDLARRSSGGTAVAVSHDAVNREVLVAFDPGLGDPDAVPQDNGCFNRLELRGDSWTVLSINELPAEQRLPELSPRQNPSADISKARAHSFRRPRQLRSRRRWSSPQCCHGA